MDVELGVVAVGQNADRVFFKATRVRWRKKERGGEERGTKQQISIARACKETQVQMDDKICMDTA